MRAYNNSTNSSNGTRHSRSTSSCSYCGDVDHQVTSCPHVETDWAMFQAFNIPCSDPNNWTNNPKAKAAGQNHWGNQQSTAHWFKQPSGWSKWYAQCEKAFEKMQAKKQRDAIKSKVKSSGKRANTCGFCGKAGHNRRDCPEMQALNKRLIKANNHWRQRLYDYFVEELGLGNGALVKCAMSGGWQQPDTEHVGIITSINWDELNMFCYVESNKRGWRHKNGRVHDNLQAPLAIKVNVNGEEHFLEWTIPSIHNGKDKCITDHKGEPLVDVFPYSWRNPTFKSVMSPTETPLSAEWLTQGQAECVEFITKKYSFAKLKEWQAISLLESYENKYNLR